jgi:hypothetical protein
MKPAENRRGFLTLRTAGRAFWFGLAASLAVHAFFIASGRFPKAQLDSPPLEARLEPEAFEAVAPLEPETLSEPATPVQPQPEPQPDSGSFEPFPDIPVPSPMPVLDEEPIPPRPEPVLPLSKAEPPPAAAQPYALLAQAAERIRNLPSHIEIVYELNGTVSGRQTHTWQLSGQHYTLESEGMITGLTGLFVRGKLIQKSSGRIGPLGLEPERYEMQHITGKQEALHFDYATNTIESSRTDAKRGTRTLELPLLTGVQDPLSSIYQLAMAAQDGKDGLIIAASSKKVKGYPYRMLGAETLSTPMGEMKTLHVARAGDTAKSGTQLWLSPAHHSLPVKVSYVDEDGREWVLEAVSIKAQ